MKPIYTIIKEVLIPLVTVVTAVLVAVLNSSVANVETQLKASQEQRAERESYQSVDLKIYDKVIASLEAKDPQKQLVAQALVNVMASDSFRVKLLNVLQKTAEDTVKKEVERIIKEDKFDAEEKTVVVTKKSIPEKYETWLGYNIDIFWCEDSGDSARQKAELIEQRLLELGAKGRIRIRQLPSSINSRSGYRISGNVIRANNDENQVAAKLLQATTGVLGNEFEILPSSQPTPGYISAFICK